MNTRPFGLLAELTYRCPLRCLYCSNPVRYPQGHAELNTDEWTHVFRQAADLGVLHALLSGGEPLQRKDIEMLIEAAHDAGLYTNLITSGVGLTLSRAKRLKKAGLDSVQISFQADEPALALSIAGTNAFRSKLLAVQAVQEINLPLTINVVIHRFNIHRIPQIIEFAVNLKAKRLELANTQYYGWAFKNRRALLPSAQQIEDAAKAVAEARKTYKNRIEILYVLSDYHSLRPKPCMNGWGRRYLCVNPIGDVLPCPTAYEIPNLTFDSVRERSLQWIWEHSEAFNRFRGTEWMQEPCSSCPYKEIDFGGCRCQAALLTGDPSVTDPVCVLSPHHPLLERQLQESRQSLLPQDEMKNIISYRTYS
ncbi:coenzyme PQQ biosynthesis enzyme PqqE [Chthonomonas calidirosea]|uniref:PqqA peptide cyclase n=1 Tax=Chthonomonas calidirosea (strain DSM 23976 / ICMP 18418 / T49) TaxID=1303518 RepID=S0EWR1_CHTCT|nr:pyrroloquinoline quinone biosynthesis protein PqqE [Chthonomonas calidirosea]CCW34183.1 coenzyme PQQ biosynthesis enzyme PqqE [Chthonomonas calidirosea T49]CEK15522.1 coenzyme PQQ biosynthesis enzyme PqqE [Chthonomonas calidirosea]